MNSSNTCRLFRVSGRVQGVFFRASTREKAESLGLTGYAVNLDNGDVEVLACGEEARIRELENWLWQGPPMAVVAQVRSETRPYESPPSFRTGSR
jgi:acylphosphatase